MDEDADDEEVVGPPMAGPTFKGGNERVDLMLAFGSNGCKRVCRGGMHCNFCDVAATPIAVMIVAAIFHAALGELEEVELRHIHVLCSLHH